ncbi:multicopper oxidase domain-containing protein [Actinoplanes sp. G11-F43]|uniref:multicopper oxidase domain-containing protein n=1 Tax=Actinoplanes sp. G11-F43 TaxID=3424130 RepID=UPI003D33CC0F
MSPHEGGFAAGIALVLLAVLTGTAVQHASTPSAVTAETTTVTPTGHTTTVAVTADKMRFTPSTITVPAGDRLVIELTNNDERRHDLVLATGAKTGTVARGETVRLDAGITGAPVDGWCSLAGHRTAGMTLTITTEAGSHTSHQTTAPTTTSRDATAPVTPAGRLHKIGLVVKEVNGSLWTYNGTAPGPVLRGKVGDTFEVTLTNDGSVDHGVDFHAGALAPDGPMRPIDPGETLTYRFTATKAGIWMYHCSTMPMLLHIANGMYGAVIIDPPDLPPVDREYVLVQSEFYGDDPETPTAVTFNGQANQYDHQPLTARTGERVRFWVLNAGPNRGSSFHVVGAQFDTVYAEGRRRLGPSDPGGAQVLDLSPAAGGYVETVLPEAGHYPFVSHVMVDAERGAHGQIEVTP